MSDYQIQPGDTLSKIAKQYGVTVKQLQEANGIKNPNLIFAGKSLKIPIQDDGAFNIPGLTIEPGKAVPVYGVPVNPNDNKGTNPTYPTITPSSIQDPGKHLMYGVPVNPKDPSIQPTLPTSIKPSNIPDPSIVAMYAVITRPSDSSEPTLPTLPTAIKPSDMTKPSMIPMYAAPIKPSDSTEPTLPVLPTAIKPSDIKEPSIVAMYAVITRPSDGSEPVLPTGLIKPSDSTEPSMIPMYAAPINPSGIRKPKKPRVPTLPTLPTLPSGEPTPPQAPVKPKNPIAPLTPEQKKAAESMGKFTARYLAGYTTDTEQEAIIRNINNVKNNNVKEFLKSYEAHRYDETITADAFFTQVHREWGFDEKQDIMKRVALRLAANLAESGKTVDANTIKAILKHNEISAADARMLDRIYQDNI